MACLPVPIDVWRSGVDVPHKDGTKREMPILGKTPVYAPVTGLVEYIWQANPGDSHVIVRIVSAEKTKSGDDAVYQLGPLRGDLMALQRVTEGDVIGYVMRWMKEGWSKERFRFAVKVRRKRAQDGKEDEKFIPISQWEEKSRPRMRSAPKSDFTLEDVERMRDQLEKTFPVETHLLRKVEDNLKKVPDILRKVEQKPNVKPEIDKKKMDEVLGQLKKLLGDTKATGDAWEDMLGVLKGTLAGLGLGAAGAVGISKLLGFFQGISSSATALSAEVVALEASIAAEAGAVSEAAMVTARGLAAEAAALSSQAQAGAAEVGSFLSMSIFPLLFVNPYPDQPWGRRAEPDTL